MCTVAYGLLTFSLRSVPLPQDPSLDPLAHPPSPGPSAFPTFPCPTVPSAEPLPLPLLVADSGRVAAHLAHAFPWSPAARLHTALRLRRTSVAAPAVAAGPAVTVVARLPPAAAGGGAAASARPAAAAASATAAAVATATALPLVAAAAARHRQVVGQLLGALSGGARAVSGWLAACEMLLEEGAAQAALDAAKEVRRGMCCGHVVGVLWASLCRRAAMPIHRLHDVTQGEAIRYCGTLRGPCMFI